MPMPHNFFLLHSLIVYTLAYGAINKWGEWHSWERCPTGKFVFAMQLKTEPDQYDGKDDSALNGIRLYCAAPGNETYSNSITSGVGAEGNWGKISKCSGLAVGFSLKEAPDSGRCAQCDDLAATNLQLICASGENLEGDGLHWGEWSPPQKCPQGHAICGIRTQVEHVHPRDVSGLNNVDMECCPVPQQPVLECTPTDGWLLVGTYDNTKSATDAKWSDKQMVGIGRESSKSEEGKSTDSKSLSMSVEVSSSIPKLLTAKFASGLGLSKSTEYNWKTASAATFTAERTTEISFTISPGVKSVLYQTVGTCGDYTVHTNHFKKVDSDVSTAFTVPDQIATGRMDRHVQKSNSISGCGITIINATLFRLITAVWVIVPFLFT